MGDRGTRWALVVVVAVLTSACGGSGETTSTAGAQATTTAAGPAPTAAAATTLPRTTAVATASNTRFGTILVDPTGRSLYFFDGDSAGDDYGYSAATSGCTGACLQTWPALLFTGAGVPVGGAGVAAVATFERPDGTKQVTVSGKPLYRYAGDFQAGEVNGDGIGGVWHVAKP